MSVSECKKIMIVEVDHATRAVLSAYIHEKRANWLVFEAENAYQAIEIAMQETIDFFTIDYYLPCLSGLNLIIELKRIHTPGKFVLLTSPLTDHLKTEIEVMSIEHLDKPVTSKIMNAMLRYFSA